MPCSYVILPEPRFVYSRLWGVVTDAMLLGHAQALGKDPRFKPDFAQFSDFREVVDVKVTTAGVREAAAASSFGIGARRALVASSDLIFGMARMYEVFREKAAGELMVFRDVQAALRWLGDRAPSGWNDIPILPPDWLSETDQRLRNSVAVQHAQSGKVKGGGSIKIFEAAAEGGLSHSSESASRIKFKMLLSKNLAQGLA